MNNEEADNEIRKIIRNDMGLFVPGLEPNEEKTEKKEEIELNPLLKNAWDDEMYQFPAERIVVVTRAMQSRLYELTELQKKMMDAHEALMVLDAQWKQEAAEITDFDGKPKYKNETSRSAYVTSKKIECSAWIDLQTLEKEKLDIDFKIRALSYEFQALKSLLAIKNNGVD